MQSTSEDKDKARGKALSKIFQRILFVISIPMLIGIPGSLLVVLDILGNRYDLLFGQGMILSLGLWGLFLGTLGIYASFSSYIHAKKTNFMPFKGHLLMTLTGASLCGVLAYNAYFMVLDSYEKIIAW